MSQEDDEWQDERSDTSSDFEETDSIASYDSLNLDETQKKNDLLDEKLRLILRYNAGAIDLDQVQKLLRENSKKLDEINLITEYANNDLVNKEYSFIELLEIYYTKIKSGVEPAFINEIQINSLNNLYLQIKHLRDEMIEERVDDHEPLDSNSLDEIFDDLIKREEKYLVKVVNQVNKRLTNKIKIPKRSNYDSDQDYNTAYIQFYKEIGKYIQGINVSKHMNITSLGSSYDKFEKTVRQDFLESVKLNKTLPVKVSDQDILRAKDNILLKRIMMKLNEKQLIECAIQVEVYNDITRQVTREKFEISPIVLQKIKKFYSKKLDVYGVITPALRNGSVKQLVKEIQDPRLMKNLEQRVYSLTNPNFIEYTSKINDILFIFRNYPNFKNYLLESRITIDQLVLFEREIAFETLINVSSIKNRRSVLKNIKDTLLKNTIYNNRLVNNYKCNVVSKRLELLLLDVSKNKEMYNNLVEKLIKFIKQKEVYDYSNLNPSDITALISQEKNVIDELDKKRSIIEKDILTWKCPLRVVKNDKQQWELLLKTKNLNELIKYRKKLLKKYDLPEDERLVEIKERLLVAHEKYNNLKKYLIKLKENQEHVIIPVEYPKVSYPEITFTKSDILINELIQCLKRRLMIDSLSIPQPSKNKLINILELMDLNDLLHKNVILQRKLLVDINNILPSGYNFFDFNNYYYTTSQNLIKPYIDGNTIKFKYTAGKLLDFYGDDIFNKLYNSKTPEDMYTKFIRKEYTILNNNSKIKQVPEYRRLRVLYNPYNGTFGSQAQDGYLFDVEKLSIGNDGKPLEDIILNESIDPRTNQMVYKRVKLPVPGKIPFIKVPVLSNRKDTFTWIRVGPEYTKMYADNHDSCSRFNNKETECNQARGLGNNPCLYNTSTKKCVTNYKQLTLTNFGKIGKLTNFGKRVKPLKKIKVNFK